jgi:hypothetical protein
VSDDIQTKIPKNQKIPLIYGAIYSATILGAFFGIGLKYLVKVFLIESAFTLACCVILSLVIAFIVFKIYYKQVSKGLIWSFKDREINSPSLKKHIDISDIKKAYIGANTPLSHFRKFGINLTKQYYPELPDVYETVLVLILNSNEVLPLYLSHCINGDSLIKKLKESIKEKMCINEKFSEIGISGRIKINKITK